jgi:hypothetical protein
MAQFKDDLPSQSAALGPGQLGWIHDLAKAEIHPEAERLLQLGRSYDPQQLIEESTIDFLSSLRDQFSEAARLFNVHSDSGARYQEIKVYNIAQSAADFMVFRNSVKLVVANSAHGVIQVSFAQHIRGTMLVDGMAHGSTTAPLALPAGLSQAQELLAQIGPFRDVYWTFQGEKITPMQVAKFYFIEFARATRDVKRSRAGNQLLIDQIKALLQEKGLEL